MAKAPLFRTVLFDLDGTLVDAFTTIHRSYLHTLPQFGLPAPTMPQVRRAVGGGLARAMSHFLPEQQIPAAVKVHTAYANSILLEDVKLMAGAEPLLQMLHARGITLGVLTNKLGDASRRICAHLGIAPFLGGVFGAHDTPWLKPQPEFTAHALKQLGANPAGTLLVGDSPFDIESAQCGGFPCWCVATGTHSAEELTAAGGKHVFADLDELAAALQDRI